MKLFNLITITMLATSQALAANPVCKDESGTLYCTTGEIDTLTHLGKTNLSGTHVTGQVNIMGNLDATKAELGSLNVTGNTDATNIVIHNTTESIGNVRAAETHFDGPTQITGDLKGGNNLFASNTKVIGTATLNHDHFKSLFDITGKLQSESATFAASVMITACESSFYRSVMPDITMNAQPQCPSSLQKIFLKDKSQVKGNITFRGGNGKVYLSKDSALMGQIIGGSVIRE